MEPNSQLEIISKELYYNRIVCQLKELTVQAVQTLGKDRFEILMDYIKGFGLDICFQLKIEE